MQGIFILPIQTMDRWVTPSFDDFDDFNSKPSTSTKPSKGKSGKISSYKAQDSRKRPRKDEGGESQSWSRKKKMMEGQTWADRHAPEKVVGSLRTEATNLTVGKMIRSGGLGGGGVGIRRQPLARL